MRFKKLLIGPCKKQIIELISSSLFDFGTHVKTLIQY